MRKYSYWFAAYGVATFVCTAVGLAEARQKAEAAAQSSAPTAQPTANEAPTPSSPTQVAPPSATTDGDDTIPPNAAQTSPSSQDQAEPSPGTSQDHTPHTARSPEPSESSASTLPEAPSPSPAAETSLQAGPGDSLPRMPSAMIWDLNLDGAAGRVFADPAYWGYFGRARLGVTWVRDPAFYSLGVTYDIGKDSYATVGVQGEAMHLSSGCWLQAGAMLDLEHRARPGGSFSLGFSVVGVELQVKDLPDHGWTPALYGKIRIPVGLLAFALTER